MQSKKQASRAPTKRKPAPPKRRTVVVPRTSGDAIAIALEAACREIRELPSAGSLRSAVVVPHRDGHFGSRELAAEDERFVRHASEAINDLLVCVANVLERDLPEEQQRPYREHVHAIYMRRFTLDESSEPHARVALVGLVRAIAEEGWPPGLDDAGVREMIAERASWVVSSYAEDFPAYARRLSVPKKRAAIGAAISAWALHLAGHGAQARVWEAFETIGQGVFGKNSWKDWRDNVWTRLRDRVWSDEPTS